MKQYTGNCLTANDKLDNSPTADKYLVKYMKSTNFNQKNNLQREKSIKIIKEHPSFSSSKKKRRSMNNEFSPLYISRRRSYVDTDHMSIKQFKSINDNLKTSEEIKEIKEARDNFDFTKLVTLMNSDSPVECEKKLHPWAENPRTVGAVACAQIGIFAFSIEVPDKTLLSYTEDLSKFNQFSTNTIESNSIFEILNFLESEQKDRQDLALVCLSFICEDNPIIQDDVLQNNGLELLKTYLNQKYSDDIRICACTIIHHLIYTRAHYQEIFLAKDGAKYLVDLLDIKDSYYLHEVILNIEELVVDMEDETVEYRVEIFNALETKNKLNSIIAQNNIYSGYIIKEAKNLLTLLS